MRARSLTTTLAFAFAATTLAVFGLVGSFVYFALERQVRVQDDLDIVLAARHTRRLAEELQDFGDVRRFNERLESQVLGNEALSIGVADASGKLLLQHNLGATAEGLTPASERVPAAARITDNAIFAATAPDGDPLRILTADAKLGDGTVATIVIVRNMRDRWLLLDRYRDRLHLAGVAGVLLTFAIGYFLVRRALSPLREMAENAAGVTVDKLDTRIAVEGVPSELEPLIVSINGMLAGLERSFQRLSQFTADLAHDMRTPLANMRGATEVALARPRSVDEYQALLASNLEECDRLSRMIENVLFLARAEHPQFSRHMGEFEVAGELHRIAEYFEGLAEDAGVHLTVSGSGHLRADVELFRRAVSNLLANAVRHTPREGAIRLAAHADSAGVRVTVENEGEPIDPLLLERIFDRFYRGDPSRAGGPASGSSGLGLAIVRSIMELHGGRVHAESDARNTRFVLSFPPQ
ncbi:heavy metal sensor signal transduction histidine kinase [Caballeronia arationis]|jgi:two-component system heavy metal sensor histidine kinase CusS|uniref:Sensor protein n=1 Tax=Caballeronia arationis TaxID=1777142 RepID=A0A7Z7N5Z3_9BURK|nr:heavy metal sensor histidine kinase [Caballeronia arationis]SAK56711.1 heavy metal sensor signal transduction histidine kinase [Caballeronia arationis]SOE88285.1 heavy metal sensor kinase [Caballeronia arationis]